MCGGRKIKKNAFGKSKILKKKATATVDPHQSLICLCLHETQKILNGIFQIRWRYNVESVMK